MEALSHHFRQNVCQTRSPYRRGRKETAVKVFTISDESKYLLIQRVPDIGCDVTQELRKLCQRFGSIERLDLTDYPKCEDFTKTYLIKYKHFVNAIRAKKTLDDHNFLGSILHLCYAPELETIDETREKLEIRKRYLPRSLDNKSVNTLSTKSHILSENAFDCKDSVIQRSGQTVKEVVQNTELKSDVQTRDQIGDNNSNLKRKFSEMTDDLTQCQKKFKEPKETPKIRWRTKT